MWTYNSARTLEVSLPTIERASSKGNVCHKIAVDGGSKDNTQSLLTSHGWLVLNAPKKGIPYQANYALEHVDTEFFAAFEHDIILNPTWFERMTSLIASDESIGAVEGMRLLWGSKTMQAIEAWKYRADRLPVWEFSIDNTLLRTDVVKRAGRFSDEDMASADAVLRRNMFRLGYKWITDRTLISGHYRKNFLQQFRHQLGSLELATYYWGFRMEGGLPRRMMSLLGGNPIHTIRMTRQSRMLRVPLAWYVLRLQSALYQNIPHEHKVRKLVPMDYWHLEKFSKEVIESRKEISVPNSKIGHFSTSPSVTCAWCGRSARFAYSISTGWGNIRPRLSSRFGRRFFACSDSHAECVAKKVFTDAFDYVAPPEKIESILAS
jgi:glycosyltransferase involved in cell wall biosynthesis